MKLTNYEIYNIATELIKSNVAKLDIYIPAKANFFIQKNIKMLAAAGQEIEEARLKVVHTYGTEEGNGNYNFTEENAAAANKELEELFAVEQDLPIYTFSIDTLGSAEFTPTQMQALMIMIED